MKKKAKQDGASFWKKVLLVVGSLRVLVVVILFINPFISEVLSLVLDAVDSPIAYKSGWSWKKYTRYDKSLDLWWYIFILIYCFGKPIFGVMLVLFAIRIIGQIATIYSSKHELLFWFPNVFEHYFILYLVTTVFVPHYSVYFTGTYVIFPLIVAFITKMPQEYLLHRKGWFYHPDGWSKSITSVFKLQS